MRAGGTAQGGLRGGARIRAGWGPFWAWTRSARSPTLGPGKGGFVITPAFWRYVAPARAHPQLWRLAAGLAVAAGVYLLVVIVLLTGLRLVVGSSGFVHWLVRIKAPGTPSATLLLLATFSGMALAAVAAAAVHGRSPGTLFGPWRQLRHDFLVVVPVALLLYGVGEGLAFRAAGLEVNLDPATWLALLPLALAGVALQVSAEEMVFRGYLQSQLAARFASPLIWLGGPALVFGVAHYDPVSAGANAPFVVLSTVAFGLVAGDLTRITGSLGASIGLHFANNVFALLVVSVAGGITGLSLYTTTFRAGDTAALRPLMIADMVLLALIWLILRRLLRR